MAPFSEPITKFIVRFSDEIEMFVVQATTGLHNNDSIIIAARMSIHLIQMPPLKYEVKEW
ncbi:MAG: hypothetical protein STSR0009_27900 [Methanoregula sp.]